MKKIDWNAEKDRWLVVKRSISFSVIANKILTGDVLDVIANSRYKGQRIFIVKINGYIHCVPFVEDENKIFLKTIYASRKLNKKYNKK